MLISSNLASSQIGTLNKRAKNNQSVSFSGVNILKTTDKVVTKKKFSKLKQFKENLLDTINPFRKRDRIKAEAKKRFIEEANCYDMREVANEAADFERRWDYWNCSLTDEKYY